MLIAAVGGIARCGWWFLTVDPDVPFLRAENGAQWMRVDEPLNLDARFTSAATVDFETSIVIPAHTSAITLRIAALRRAIVTVDQEPVFDTGTDLDHWRTTYTVSLPSDLGPGLHQLNLRVTNDGGPALARVDSPLLGLKSADGWRASTDGIIWRAALAADHPWDVRGESSAASEMLRHSPLLSILFLIGCFPLLLRRPKSADGGQTSGKWGKRVRWALLLAWVMLAVNNFRKVPLRVGYDITAHYHYILYVADHVGLPRPDAGWQYFQSPLYYIVSAVFYRLLVLAGITGNLAACALRFVPLACGAVMVELSYRAAKCLFPRRGDLHAVAAVVGGLLPVNLYLSQTVSNEPMAAATSGVLVLLALRFIDRPALVRSMPNLLVIGAALGISVITKISALLWTVPVFAVMARAMLLQHGTVRDWCRSITAVAAVVLLVSGWFFVRNLILVGGVSFAQVSHSSIAKVQWWQDPGFRTPENLWEFGHVFSRANYGGLQSVWDSLYSTMWSNGIPSGNPPWNHGLMSCTLWLSVLPSLLIVAGICRAGVLRNDPPELRAALRFCAAAAGIFIAAIFYVYLTLPIYSCAKASYMLGTAPCLALLAASGFDLLSRHRVPRAIAGGLLFVYAVTGYFTYFLL